MVWPEVLVAQNENRHEIILSGSKISNLINQSGLDTTLFSLVNLNYLNIHDTCLAVLPDAIERLQNLQTLVLHSNKLVKLTSKIAYLDKLKILDLSSNVLEVLPEEISNLTQLVTVNVSNNQLKTLPKFNVNSRLAVIDVSNNDLTSFPDVCYSEMVNLSELRCSNNKIVALPNTVGLLAGLKVFLVNSNEIKEIPAELARCTKIKDLNLKDNPISDRRLLKLMSQGHTKKVMDYVKQHCVATTNLSVETGKVKKGKRMPTEEEIDVLTDQLHKINVRHCSNDIKVIVQENVQNLRPHLMACLVLNITFTEETFKRFIQLQTKLHDTICEKRKVATIATHDAEKLSGGNLVYTALPPNDLRIKPLNGGQELTGAQLFKKLQLEAENLRKEKKRNTYSGIHKYLDLLEGKPQYPCILNSTGEVISFPPITNSDLTKMTISTTSLFVEVTGGTSQGICKKVADTLIKEMLLLFGNLTVQQVKNVDVDGNLKSVYPSRTDLVYDDNSGILVIRE